MTSPNPNFSNEMKLIMTAPSDSFLGRIRDEILDELIKEAEEKEAAL